MNIKGLGDLNGKKEKANDDKEKRTTYAGGEKSGLLVEDKGSRGGDLIEQARRNQGPHSAQQQFKITIYRNGIYIASLDKFFSFDTDEGQSLYNDLKQGKVPEALATHLQGDVDVALEDKRGESYEKKEEKKLFQGEGVRLGHSVDDKRSESLKIGDLNIKLADKSPVHQLQLKFPNGERKVLQVNPETTMSAIRMIIEGQLKSKQFKVTTPLPVRDLTNEVRTLAELDLLDSSLNVAFI